MVLRDCEVGLTGCDVAVRTGSFTVIATDVTVLLAFAIPPKSTPPHVGAKLLWDADGDGTPDGGAILVDFNRDGVFSEPGVSRPMEIRIFGEA